MCPIKESFAKTVGYRTYGPQNRSQRYDTKIASRIAKLVEWFRSLLSETDFDDIGPISILLFLKNFCDACGSIGIYEGASMWLIFYSMKKPTSSSLEVLLSPKETCTPSLHGERLPSYVEVVNCLLTAYATDDIITHAIKKLKSYKQALGVSAALYSKRLYTKALRCVISYEERRVMTSFVEGLNE